MRTDDIISGNHIETTIETRLKGVKALLDSMALSTPDAQESFLVLSQTLQSIITDIQPLKENLDSMSKSLTACRSIFNKYDTED